MARGRGTGAAVSLIAASAPSPPPTATPEPTSRPIRRSAVRAWRRWAAPFAAALGGVLLFVPALGGYFAIDDFSLIASVHDLRWWELPRVFAADEPVPLQADQQRYRPLFLLSLWADARLWGVDPRGFRLTSLALYLLTSLLVWALARQLAGRGPASLLALVLFVVSPVHGEPVAWISGRVEVLSTAAALAAVVTWRAWRATGRRAYYGCALLAVAAAAATHEMGVITPAFLLASDLAGGRPSSSASVRGLLAAHAPCFSILGLYAVLRAWVFGDVLPAWHPLPLVGASGIAAGQLTRLAGEAATAGALAAGILLGRWPSLEELHLPRLFRAAMALGALSALGALVWRARAGRDGRVEHPGLAATARFGLAWAGIALVPLLVPLSYGPRHFFMASVGAALALGAATAALARARRAPRRLGQTAAAALVVGQLALLGSEVATWREAGRRSGLLAAEVRRAWASAAEVGGVAVVTDTQGLPVPVWGLAAPYAVSRPFMEPLPGQHLLPAYQSYYWADWDETYGPLLERAVRGEAGPILVVEWDDRRAAFATRPIDPAHFAQAGYPARMAGLPRRTE
jgi:hypothetical protein